MQDVFGSLQIVYAVPASVILGMTSKAKKNRISAITESPILLYRVDQQSTGIFRKGNLNCSRVV